jgi:hypothetical protein
VSFLCADCCLSYREYIEALEKEMQHKRQQETLETLIAEAKALVRCSLLCMLIY